VVEGGELGGWRQLVIQQRGDQAEQLDPGGTASRADGGRVHDDPDDVALGRPDDGGAGMVPLEAIWLA
jgi:hypothetical protein